VNFKEKKKRSNMFLSFKNIGMREEVIYTLEGKGEFEQGMVSEYEIRKRMRFQEREKRGGGLKKKEEINQQPG